MAAEVGQSRDEATRSARGCQPARSIGVDVEGEWAAVRYDDESTPAADDLREEVG
jgi:hypothetical protein